jgi:hypothetical protein
MDMDEQMQPPALLCDLLVIHRHLQSKEEGHDHVPCRASGHNTCTSSPLRASLILKAVRKSLSPVITGAQLVVKGMQPPSTTRVLYLSQCAKTCLTYVQRFAPLTRFRLVSIPQHSRPLSRSTMDCLIPADPDIAGIGVRAATYAQNFLSFIPAVFALLDGKVELNELKMVEKQSTTILITAFAILISAVIQSLTFGLSSFHATIILDLSWMNNTNTFIYFLLYIHHKSDPERGGDQILPKWVDWYKHVWMILRLRTTSISDHEAGPAGGPGHHACLRHTLTSNDRRQ